jgi:prophage regulatory protein
MRILRLRQVIALTGFSRSTLYRYIQNQQFPNQVRLGPRIVGWLEDEVNDWILEKVQFRNIETK